MPQLYSSRSARLLGLMLILVLGAALASCNRALDRLDDALYPSATPGAADTPAASATPQVAAAGPTFTPAASPTSLSLPPTLAEPSATPQVGAAYQFVYARAASIYRGSEGDAAPVEAAIAPQLESWAFSRGWLASAQGRALDLIDLNAGRLYSLQVNADTPVDYAEVLWSANGAALLHVAWLAGAEEGAGRSVELRGLSVPDGAELGLVRLDSATGLTVLRYDEAAGRVALIAHSADGAFRELRYYALSDGRLVATSPVSGSGVARISPDGRYLLSQQYSGEGSQLVLYDLNGEGAPLAWDQPQEHSVAHVWSPDGRSVAYLLRTGLTDADPVSQGLGVWLLDTLTMQAQQVIEETSLSASLIGWTPDGERIVGYHRGGEADTYVYTIRPDGSDRRILALPEDAEVLGWMPAVRANVPQVIVDPWRARFVQALNDTQATADLVAEIVATQSEVDDQALLRQITGYLREAGWQMDVAEPSLKRVAQSTFVVQLPPLGIYVIEPQRAQAVASGHVVLDARLAGDDLGLVTGVLGDGPAQPTYALLRRQADGTWQTLWVPMGQRDWIATDGEIAFAGEGLETLQVSGNSFGLDEGEDAPFVECRDCPHRQMVANWVRQGDQYVRQTQLAADATLADALWEMTQRTPYGVTYECVRRLRLNLPVDELVANASVLTKLRDAGLAASGVRLAPSEELADRVNLAELDGTRRYSVLVQDGRVIHVEQSQ
jgi:hypothetical protein